MLIIVYCVLLTPIIPLFKLKIKALIVKFPESLVLFRCGKVNQNYMKYLKIYLSIVAFFLLHLVFNLLSDNSVTDITPTSWLLVLFSFVGFVWVIFYTNKSNVNYKFIAYILSAIGILLSILQVINWYMLKDFGF